MAVMLSKMLGAVVGLAVALSLTAPAAAQVTIKGLADCALWVEARNVGRSVALEHYMVGFINGISMGSNVDIWGAREIRQEQFYLWIDKWCRDNPLDTLYRAGWSFADEITGGAVRP